MCIAFWFLGKRWRKVHVSVMIIKPIFRTLTFLNDVLRSQHVILDFKTIVLGKL